MSIGFCVGGGAKSYCLAPKYEVRNGLGPSGLGFNPGYPLSNDPFHGIQLHIQTTKYDPKKHTKKQIILFLAN